VHDNAFGRPKRGLVGADQSYRSRRGWVIERKSHLVLADDLDGGRIYDRPHAPVKVDGSLVQAAVGSETEGVGDTELGWGGRRLHRSSTGVR